ncbi:MAG TPA: DUF1203 domain-containing protein [Candidatus Acidoferrales bacterium]|nr:DUF1203 domain-containing protein [Candidatus Acidoferrales bacterium]
MDTSTVALSLAYLPIPDELAVRARTTLRDDFGHRLHVEWNQAPCRSCLRISRAPQELILLSYQPLPDTNPYAEIGPIFIHARVEIAEVHVRHRSYTCYDFKVVRA